MRCSCKLSPRRNDPLGREVVPVNTELGRVVWVALKTIGAGFVVIVIVIAGLVGYTLLRGQARIGVACSVGGPLARNACQFTNTGSGAGSSCVVVSLRNRSSGATIESQPTCSGEVAPGDSTDRAVMFTDRIRPLQLCPGDMDRTCEMEIVTLSDDAAQRRRSRAASPPIPPPSPEERIVTTSAGEVLTDCGRLIGGYDSAANRRPESWSHWLCLDQESAGTAWEQCLSRRQYTWNVGCPGEQRCCPPP